MTKRRINYAGSVHDEREVDAVVAVLRGGPTALRIGRNVRNMEERVAALLGKRRGVMCNSGSSALYLAIEVLDLKPGDEIITAAVTFSTDLAPMLRAQLVPVFVDVTPDTFQIDVDAIEEMIGPRTRAILTPDLIGNAPDWDRIREIADRHDLWVIEDSCDALGLTLRGTPTGTRADTVRRGGVRDAHDFGGVPEVLPAGQRAAHRAVRRRQASRVLPALGAGEVRRRRRRQDAAPMADVPRAAHQPGRRRRGRRALPGGRGGGSVRDRRAGERAGRAVKRRTGEARQVAL